MRPPKERIGAPAVVGRAVNTTVSALLDHFAMLSLAARG